MAAFDIEFPDDFLSDLLDTDFDDIAEEALSEAAPILEKSLKESCARVIEHGEGSELVSSIKAGKPKKTKTDAYIVNVSPKGYSNVKVYRNKKKTRTYPVSNALKMIWKEYGIPGQQPARPFIASACNDAGSSAMVKMQEVYNRKVGADK